MPALAAPRGSARMTRRISGHLFGQRSAFLDSDLDHVSGLEEFPARRADPGGGAGENEVARMERHSARQLRDLLGQIEDHTLAVGVLLEDVVHPELEAEILRVADVARWHDPWAERTGALECLVLGPIGLERRGIADIRASPAVARGQVIGRGVARQRNRAPFLGARFWPLCRSLQQARPPNPSRSNTRKS